MPWKPTIATDHVVRRGSDDEADFHRLVRSLAATAEILGLNSDGDGSTNMRMAFVVQDLEIFEPILEYAVGAARDREPR